jgi:hypothetical protein
MKTLFSLSILGILLFVFAESAVGQSLKAKSLKGIKGIEILVEGLDSDAQRFVSQREIANVIKRGLTSRGITVVEETGEEDRYNYLYFNLNLFTTDFGTYFSSRLEFNQMVTLQTGAFSMATTWSIGSLSSTRPSSSRDRILKAAEELVDKFVIDYFAGNR